MMRSLWPICMLTMLVLGGGGCAATQSGDDGAGGVAMEVLVHRGANSMALYQLDRDATLQFAGGSNALERTFTWSGPMDVATQDQLMAALSTHGWIDGTPAPADTSPAKDGDLSLVQPTRIDVRVQSSAGLKRFVIRGSNAGADEIIACLEHTAMARHDAFLDSLPKPSGREAND